MSSTPSPLEVTVSTFGRTTTHHVRIPGFPWGIRVYVEHGAVTDSVQLGIPSTGASVAEAETFARGLSQALEIARGITGEPSPADPAAAVRSLTEERDALQTAVGRLLWLVEVEFKRDGGHITRDAHALIDSPGRVVAPLSAPPGESSPPQGFDALRRRAEATEDLLERLCDYVFPTRDNGDYYSNGDIHLSAFAKEVNTLLSGLAALPPVPDRPAAADVQALVEAARPIVAGWQSKERAEDSFPYARREWHPSAGQLQALSAAFSALAPVSSGDAPASPTGDGHE